MLVTFQTLNKHLNTQNRSTPLREEKRNIINHNSRFWPWDPWDSLELDFELFELDPDFELFEPVSNNIYKGILHVSVKHINAIYMYYYGLTEAKNKYLEIIPIVLMNKNTQNMISNNLPVESSVTL